MRTKLFSILAGLALLGIAPLNAQEYPNKVITVIVPFAAGGPTDAVARLLTVPMSKSLGVSMIVENVGGAGGTIGANRVAKAPADGYTLFLHHIGMSTAPALYRKLPYDTINDFEPIGLINETPMTLVAKKDFPAEGFEGTDRLSKGQQGKGQSRQCRTWRGIAPVRHALHERDPDRSNDDPLQWYRSGDE